VCLKGEGWTGEYDNFGLPTPIVKDPPKPKPKPTYSMEYGYIVCESGLTVSDFFQPGKPPPSDGGITEQMLIEAVKSGNVGYQPVGFSSYKTGYTVDSDEWCSKNGLYIYDAEEPFLVSYPYTSIQYSSGWYNCPEDVLDDPIYPLMRPDRLFDRLDKSNCLVQLADVEKPLPPIPGDHIWVEGDRDGHWVKRPLYDWALSLGCEKELARGIWVTPDTLSAFLSAKALSWLHGSNAQPPPGFMSSVEVGDAKNLLQPAEIRVMSAIVRSIPARAVYQTAVGLRINGRPDSLQHELRLFIENYNDHIAEGYAEIQSTLAAAKRLLQSELDSLTLALDAPNLADHACD
jgi:hypothetical protein